MLIEFSVENWRSIKERQTLSMVKGQGKELLETNTFDPQAPATPALLKSAAIYGANASGKSTLVHALRVMYTVVVNSTEKQRGHELPWHPFAFDSESKSKPTTFEIVFVAEGVRYEYGFSFNREMILEEWLNDYPNRGVRHLFKRAVSASASDDGKYQWKYSSGLTGPKRLWQEATRANALFLSTAIQLNSKDLTPVFDWIKLKLRAVVADNIGKTFTAEQCLDTTLRSPVIDFLKAADLGIEGIEVSRGDVTEEDLPKNMPAVVKAEIMKALEGNEKFEIKSVHKKEDGNLVELGFEEESSGTQKMFALAGPWLDVLENGLVLVIDELHNSLHPKLVEHLVRMFHDPKTNPKNAQLIFTTHDTTILSQDIFRRDQIWFCEKDQSQATKLFSLSDFSPRKGRENIEAYYLAGRYGAVPNIPHQLAPVDLGKL